MESSENLTSLVADDSRWTSLTDEVYRHLRAHDTHKSVTFFKFHPIRKSTWPHKVAYKSGTEDWSLWENSWYEIKYSFRNPQARPDSRGNYVTVLTKASENVYSPTPERQELGSPYDSRNLRFRPRELATLGAAYGFLRIETEPAINGAKTQYGFKVRRLWWLRFFVSALLALGVGSAGVPALLAPETTTDIKLRWLVLAVVLTFAVKAFDKEPESN